MRGANWIKDHTKTTRKGALKGIKKVNCDRKGKTFKLIKVCDKPPTWKEVEVTE